MTAELLPSFLKQSPADKARDDEAQELRRASFGRGHLTEAERLVSRGAAMEEIARRDLETMEAAHGEGKNRSAQGGATLEMIEREKEKLAEALALQGKYLEAAEVHPKARRADDFREIHVAIERDDTLCSCPRVEKQDPLTGQTLSISPRRNLKTVYSPRHKEAVALIKCEVCKTLNARPITGQAAEIGAATNQAAVAARAGMRASVSDAQLLKKNG